MSDHVPVFAVAEKAVTGDVTGALEMLRWAMSRFGDAIAFTQCMPNGMNASLTFAEVEHVELGKRPFDAAIVGAREVGWTLLSMNLALVAVFVSILFMGGPACSDERIFEDRFESGWVPAPGCG